MQLKFLSLILLIASAVNGNADVCPIESVIIFNGQTQTIIAPTSIECGSLGCVEVSADIRSMGFSARSKTCRSLAQLNTKLPMTDGQLIDFSRCNSAYTTKLQQTGSNQVMDAKVNLRCSKPASVQPVGPFCQVFSSMTMNDREEVFIQPTSIECPSRQCYEVTTFIQAKGSVVKTRDLNCALYADIEAKLPFADGKIVDLTKCNQNYNVGLTTENTNERINANVQLKCFQAV